MLLVKIVTGMTLIFLGTSIRFFGMAGPFICDADHLLPQLQPIFARLTPNFLQRNWL
jgi:hypothetical protein